MADPVCDFCSDPNPTWDYPARTFETAPLPCGIPVSLGHWAACDVCHALIEQNDREGIIRRTVTSFYEKYPEFKELLDTPEFESQTALLHNQFFHYRSGPAVSMVNPQPTNTQGSKQDERTT
jgi:hypothetical protein